MISVAALGDQRARDAVDVDAGSAGANCLETAQLGREDERVDLLSPLAELARWRRSACSPSSSRRAPRPSRSRPARRSRWGPRAAGRAATRRARRRRRSCRSSARWAPSSRMWFSSASATSRSVRPTRPSASNRSSASSASMLAARIRSTSSGSLIARSPSTRPLPDTSSTRSSSSSRSRRVRRHRHVSRPRSPAAPSRRAAAHRSPRADPAAPGGGRTRHRPRRRPARRSGSR